MPKRDRNDVCAFCAQPVHFAHLPLGKSQWVHSNPLGELKVSVTEFNRVMADAISTALARPFDALHAASPQGAI